MFLRRCERSKNGKKHTYWALVESVRTAKGSRQRVVAYLGELKAGEQSGWARLGRRLDRRSRPQRSLFDPPQHEEPTDDESVLVRLKGIRLERLRDFGDVWLAWGLWRLLGLDTLLAGLIAEGREEVPWPAVALILVIARFCEPASELHIEHTWYRRTALEELVGVTVAQVHTDRLYAGLDQLLPHKDALERHLKERLGNLFECGGPARATEVALSALVDRTGARNVTTTSRGGGSDLSALGSMVECGRQCHVNATAARKASSRKGGSSGQ
jgi:hypothetical protein